MKKLKILLLTAQVISQRDYERFAIETLGTNNQIIIIDFTNFLQPKAFQKQFKLRKKDLNTIFIKNIFEISAQIKLFEKSNLIISLLGSQNELNNTIYKILQPFEKKICLVYMSAFPREPLNLKYFFFKKLYCKLVGERLFFLLNKFKKVSYTLKNKFSKNKKLKPGFLFVNGKEVVNHYFRNIDPKTKIFQTCSYDYMLSKKKYKRLLNSKYAVFLDEYIVHHPDFKILKWKVEQEKIYYEELNNLFHFIEDELNLKVIIASHPRADIEFNKKKLQGFDIHKGNTAQLVKYSEICITHASTSINFAVIFNKPILFITTNRMKIRRYDNELLASWFNKKPINISLPYSKNEIVDSLENQEIYKNQYFINFISPLKKIEFGFKPLLRYVEKNN